jgi:hypothetical protein
MSQERRLKDFVKTAEVGNLCIPIESVWVKTIAYNTAVVVCEVRIKNKHIIYVHNQLFNNNGAFSLMRRVKSAGRINLQHWRK